MPPSKRLNVVLNGQAYDIPSYIEGVSELDVLRGMEDPQAVINNVNVSVTEFTTLQLTTPPSLEVLFSMHWLVARRAVF